MTLASVAHVILIAIHVLCGTTALVIGLVQLAGDKRGRRHRARGRIFVWLIWITVATAATGLVLFRFNAFLAVLTLLVAYWTYSGMRAVRLRGRPPMRQDAVVSVIALVTAAVFVVGLPYVRFPWVPAIIYSTLGAMCAVSTYDLLRFTFPRHWFASLWLYEHVVKMIGAHAAVVSAFAGTVLAAAQPYSQILPSVMWTLLQVGFVLWLRRENRRGQQTPAVPGVL